MQYFVVNGDVPEKAMAPHPSTLAWKIPWTEEPGRLQSLRLQRVKQVRSQDVEVKLHYPGGMNVITGVLLEEEWPGRLGRYTAGGSRGSG